MREEEEVMMEENKKKRDKQSFTLMVVKATKYLRISEFILRLG